MLTEFFSTHNAGLMALAVAVNALLTWVAFFPVRSSHLVGERHSVVRTLIAGALLGISNWISFLLVLKGYFPLQPIMPPPAVSAIACTLAIAGSSVAVAVARHSDAGLRGMLLAGSILAATISCLVFAIMSGLAAPLTLAYDLSGILASMVAGGVLAGFGFRRLRLDSDGARTLAPIMVLALAGPIVDLGTLGSILPFSEWTDATATPGALALQPLTVVFLSEIVAVLALSRTGAAVDRRTTARAQQEAERLRQLADSTFEGIVVHRDGLILDTNTAFCNLIGRRPQQLVGQPIDSLATEFLTPDRRGPAEFDLPTDLGNTIPVEVLSRTISLRDGEAEVVAVRDISERRAAEQSARDRRRALDLQREADEARERQQLAEQANQAKSRFLAMMSHEIRTPLNAVLGLASTMLGDNLTPNQRQVVLAIHESGDSLLRILNDVLDFSRLDAGRMTVSMTAFAPEQLTRQVSEIYRTAAAAKGVALNWAVDDRLPRLSGDSGRIRQILHNLLSNAVKFTAEGNIVVRARCVTANNQQATVEWSVIDSGIGIPPDKLPGLFDAFMQADDSITRRFGGSGLGLAISKQLAALMGGTIAVESYLGEGSIFTLSLTLQIAPPEEAATTPLVEPHEAVSTRLQALGRPLDVLLAEDNKTNRFLIQQMLGAFAIDLVIAPDGAEAVRLATESAFDMIFMDMRMPVMDGLEATRRIRAGGGPCRRVPILAMTANAFQEDQDACAAAGMTDFIAKPINRPTLLEAIARAMPGDG